MTRLFARQLPPPSRRSAGARITPPKRLFLEAL